MDCCSWGATSEERKALRFLLGPLQNVSDRDWIIYRQASLFQPVFTQNKDTQPEKPTGENVASDACAADEPHVAGDFSEAPRAQQGDSNNSDLFFPLEWTIKSQRVQQTFNMWKAPLDLNWKFRRMKKRRNIALQPLDEFPDFVFELCVKGEVVTFFEFLQKFTSIYFLGFGVALLEPLIMEKENWQVRKRVHPKTSQEQYHVKDIQKCLQRHIPRNCFCTVGISWTDLYPSEDLNFVLGEAHSGLNSGVLSFGRFEPKLYRDEEGYVPPAVDKFDGKLLWQMLKVLSHETCHILGLGHCVYFECNMNESKSVTEAMSQPLYLCPVCLRKLQKACKFDVKERYTLLHAFLQDLDNSFSDCDRFSSTSDWLKKCLVLLEEESTKL